MNKKNYYRPTNATVLVVFTTYFDCGFLPIGHIIVFVDKMPYVRAILAFLVIVHIEREIDFEPLCMSAHSIECENFTLTILMYDLVAFKATFVLMP